MRGKMLVFGDQVDAKRGAYELKIKLMHDNNEDYAFTYLTLLYDGEMFGNGVANEKNLLLATIDVLDQMLANDQEEFDYTTIQGFEELLSGDWQVDNVLEDQLAKLHSYEVLYSDSVRYAVTIENFGW